MIFALGVLVAGLLALMFLPAFWARAVRLSTRRIEMQLPLSMDEIVAERDLLRAEFAVAQRRLEQQIERLGDMRAAGMGELGRKIALLGEQAKEAEDLRAQIAERDAAILRVEHEASDLRAQLGAALKDAYDSDGAYAVAEAAVLTQARRAETAEAVMAEQRMVIAGLETRLSGLEMRAGDLQNELSQRDKTILARDSVVDRVTDERDRARAEAAGHATKVAALQTQIEDRDRRLAALDDRVAEMQREKAALERQIEEARRGESERLAVATEARAQVERQLETARAGERKLLADVDTLRAEKAALQGALDASRAELAGRGDERSAKRAASPAIVETDPRRSGSDLGVEVLRLAAALESDRDGTRQPEGEQLKLVSAGGPGGARLVARLSAGAGSSACRPSGAASRAAAARRHGRAPDPAGIRAAPPAR